MSNPSNSSNTSNVGQPSSLTNGTAHSLNQPVQNKDMDVDNLEAYNRPFDIYGDAHSLPNLSDPALQQYPFYPNVAGAPLGNNEGPRPRWAFL